MESPILSLPDLILWKIADILSDDMGDDWQPSFKRVHVARRVAALACTSRAVQTSIALKVAERIDPINDYDRLVVQWKHNRPATGVMLKKACRDNRLPVGGRVGELRERLREKLGRLASNGLSRAFVAEVEKQDTLTSLNSPSIILEQVGLVSAGIPGITQLKKRTSVLLMIARERGDPMALRARMLKANDEKRAIIRSRREILEAALAARNCPLRSDSKLCSDFVQGVGGMSLERVVDETEAIKFFYDRTNYSSILRGLRSQQRNRGFDRDFGSRSYWGRREMYKMGILDSDEEEDEDDEEARRREAKAEALKRWLGNAWNKAEDLPRLLRRT